jgi:hypothetical protein
LTELPSELIIKIVLYATMESGVVEVVPNTVGGVPSLATRNVDTLYRISRTCKALHAVAHAPGLGYTILDLAAIKQLQRRTLARPILFACARLLRRSPALHTLRLGEEWADDEVCLWLLLP